MRSITRFTLSILLAAVLAACAGTPTGPVAYTTTPGHLKITELGPDRVPGQSWTVDASTVKRDRNTDVLTAPGIPHPVRSYTTEELP